MKIIELLNKIANEEEVPKKIKLKAFELKRTQSSNVHRLYVDDDGMFFPKNYDFYLNDEVEILEEENKIPGKLGYCKENTFMEQKETTYLSSKERVLLDSNFKELGNKINEIIDYFEYLKSKGDE